VEETGEPGENNRPVASHWQTLENTEGANKNVQSIKTGSMGFARHKMKTTKTKHNTVCVGKPLCAKQKNTNNVNKTWALL
jgi:hypothetical protein